jgi:hypothetical protein
VRHQRRVSWRPADALPRVDDQWMCSGRCSRNGRSGHQRGSEMPGWRG